MAMPAVTEPPGELMYSMMSFSEFSAERSRSWAQIWLAMASSTCWPRTMIRSHSSRSYTESLSVMPEPGIRICDPGRCRVTGCLPYLSGMDLLSSTVTKLAVRQVPMTPEFTESVKLAGFRHCGTDHWGTDHWGDSESSCDAELSGAGGLIGPKSLSTSTSLPEASVTFAPRSTVATALPRRTS